MINQILLILCLFNWFLSFGIIISNFFKLSDPRTTGSRNPGATNVMRTGNKVAALLTLLGDILKLLLLLLIAILYEFKTEIHLAVVSLAVLLGHIYPVYYKFKGGKGSCNCTWYFVGY